MKEYKNKYGILYNCDCMEYMKTLPDKYFELAIVDPPYGIGDFNCGDTKKSKAMSSKKNIKKLNGITTFQKKNILFNYIEFLKIG